MTSSLLFAGLLINREKLPAGTAWLQKVSFFHAAFEALLVNEGPLKSSLSLSLSP